jgi:hypothetical protein
MTTKPGNRTTTKPGNRTTTKPGNKVTTKPGRITTSASSKFGQHQLLGIKGSISPAGLLTIEKDFKKEFGTSLHEIDEVNPNGSLKKLIMTPAAALAKQITSPAGKTTTKPGNKTTTKPGNKTTTRPAGRTTTRPVGKVTTKPGNKTTTRPAGRTTTRPVGKVTTKPGNKTTTRPAGRTTTKPVGRTTTKPVGRTTTKPVGRTTTRPVGRTTTKPAGRTTTKPVGRTTTKPAGRTTTKPVGRTTTKPVGRTTTRPVGRTTTKPAAKVTTKPAKKTTTKPAKKTTTKASKKKGGGTLELVPEKKLTGSIPAHQQAFLAQLKKDGIPVTSIKNPTAAATNSPNNQTNQNNPNNQTNQNNPNNQTNQNNPNNQTNQTNSNTSNSTGNPLNPDGNKAFPYANLLSNPETAIEVLGEQLRGMTAQINETPSPLTHKINDQKSVTYYEFAVTGPGGQGLRLFRVYVAKGTPEQKLQKVIQIRDSVGSGLQLQHYVQGPAGLQTIINDTKRVIESQAQAITSAQTNLQSYKTGMETLDESQTKIVKKLIPALETSKKADQQSQVTLMKILNAAQSELAKVTA